MQPAMMNIYNLLNRIFRYWPSLQEPGPNQWASMEQKTMFTRLATPLLENVKTSCAKWLYGNPNILAENRKRRSTKGSRKRI